MRSFRFCVYGLIILFGCQAAAENEYGVSEAPAFDSTSRTIFEWQDKRDTEGLLSYFDHEDARYRALAARAFASLKDTAAVEMLSFLLNDPDSSVRIAAALAIGLTRDSIAIEPLASALSVESVPVVRRELLESLGRVIDQPGLIILQQQAATSAPEKEGLAWGLYRAGIRNVSDQFSEEIALSLLDPSETYQTRLGAAHFFQRSSNLNICNYAEDIRNRAGAERAVNVQMALVRSLSKCDDQATLEFLKNLAMNAADYRIRINAVIALSGKEGWASDDSLIDKLMTDDNVNVQVATAEQLQARNISTSAIQKWAGEHPSVRVKSLLLSIMVKDDDDWLREAEGLFNSETNPVNRAHLLRAISLNPESREFIMDHIFSGESKIISTSAFGAFLRQIENSGGELSSQEKEVIINALFSNDLALSAYASGYIQDKWLLFSDSVSEERLNQAINEAKSERKAFIYRSLLSKYSGEEAMEEPVFSDRHPVNWEILEGLDEKTTAKIITSKGSIVLKLFPWAAPGSVANFVSLAESGFYNGIVFHRVVPNFVIQAGSSRGDGIGEADYAIRTEISGKNYSEGMVGMASSGKDTEGTQWFITHSPTPHLDDNYTIFAQVIEGMDVVHVIEEGDVIDSIDIIKSTVQ